MKRTGSGAGLSFSVCPLRSSSSMPAEMLPAAANAPRSVRRSGSLISAAGLPSPASSARLRPPAFAATRQRAKSYNFV